MERGTGKNQGSKSIDLDVLLNLDGTKLCPCPQIHIAVKYLSYCQMPLDFAGSLQQNRVVVIKGKIKNEDAGYGAK